MRVEQRIGRIDRIGQEYDRVWIRNYFYDGTVEATVYQRLDDRIASFESVVGELQPILSQVARVIEAAAMANDRHEGSLIAKAIDDINRQVQSAEITSLDLDKLTDDAVTPPPKVPAPITMCELEKIIVGSTALGDRLKPHSTIPRAHLLDWHGHWREVTFDPRLFDEHPNTLTLLSFGSELLREILSAVEAPQTSEDTGVIARCAHRQIAVGYYGLPVNGPITSVVYLAKALDEKTAVNVPFAERQRLDTKFAILVRNRLETEKKAADDRRKAQLSSLTEEIRQLLVDAAYVELARAANRDLFDEALPLDFSEQAYQRLKRHKVPFSGAETCWRWLA